MVKSIICLGRGSLGRTFEDRGVKCYDRRDVDVNDISALNETFAETRPRYVINCTGVVGTGKCEHEPEMAYMVNVGGVANIAYMCKKYDSRIIHFSTFYAGDYNVYTRTKMLSENIINDLLIKKWIVRLPWIFGRHTDNFILSAVRGKEVAIYDDEVGYLAYDEDIADYVIDNIDSNGISLLANKGKVYRKDIVNFIGAKYKTMDRTSNMPLQAPEPNIKLRSWKEPMGELLDGIRSV